jgi:hypothetical protein
MSRPRHFALKKKAEKVRPLIRAFLDRNLRKVSRVT